MTNETADPNQPPPDDPSQNEFANAWTRFVGALRRLLAGAPDERVLDPYISLKDAALDAAESEPVVQALQAAWDELHSASGGQVPAHLILLEVQAFPAAVEISQVEQKRSEERRSLLKRLLGIGKITVDSICDILDTLPPHLKALLKAISEAISIFKGD